MRYTALIFSILQALSSIHAQVVISGKAPSYAGCKIDFLKTTDPFTSNEVSMGYALVDDSGLFSATLPVVEITYTFVHLGIYKGYMFVEPGKNYTVSLPDKTDKTQANRLNPFFVETEFQFAIKNITDDDINFKTLAFNDTYQPYFNKFAGNIRGRNSKALIDSTISLLRNTSPVSDNPFYNTYVHYKIGYLKHLAYQQKSKSISAEYFQNKPLLLSNPAYVELFNQVYNKYFFMFSRTSYGKKITTDISVTKSYSGLTQTLLQDSILVDTQLRELVILKNIHDEFYAGNFSRSGLLCILDSLLLTSQFEHNIAIGRSIRQKITRLMPGYEAPAFSLLDKNKNIVNLSDLRGKYVYLNFCLCNSYACIKEFELLKKIAELHGEKLIIVTISVDDTREEMSEFVQKSGYNWLFLHIGNQPNILKDYDIRAFPMYYLIDKEGKMVFSPAQSPGENFEMYLFQLLRSRKEI